MGGVAPGAARSAATLLFAIDVGDREVRPSRNERPNPKSGVAALFAAPPAKPDRRSTAPMAGCAGRRPEWQGKRMRFPCRVRGRSDLSFPSRTLYLKRTLTVE